jgi:agmatine deiminase
MLGVRKVIWIPTGVVEDNGTFRGALAKHIHVPRFDGVDIPHAGVYTLFTTNGHTDEFLRFVAPTKVVLAQEVLPQAPARTPTEKLIRWMQQQNQARLERAYEIISHATTQSGERIQVIRMPTPVLTLEVFKPGDGIYDYYAAYDRWEDGSKLPEVMLGVWPASYVNYVPTNDLVIVSRFWRPGRPLEMWNRDFEASQVLRLAFPGREIVQVHSENVNRGGGGMNCITQQQPASNRFAQKCGWAKVQVDTSAATLFAAAVGSNALGIVTRLSKYAEGIYLKRLSSEDKRVRVRVMGHTSLDGKVGWIDEENIESAGEKCAAAYSLN